MQPRFPVLRVLNDSFCPKTFVRPLNPPGNLATISLLSPPSCIYKKTFIGGAGAAIADTEARDHSGMTALHHAAIRGHQNILLLLLHAEADFNAVTGNEDSPLHLVSLPVKILCDVVA